MFKATNWMRLLRRNALSLLGQTNHGQIPNRDVAGGFELECVSFNLRECVDGVMGKFLHPARSKHLQLDLVWDGSLPTFVRGDLARLRHVLVDRIGSAIKSTEQGFVRVMVMNTVCSKTMHKIMFEVQDTGTANSRDAHVRGRGSELVISRQIVQSMRGEIGLESSPESGAKFWFTAEFEVVPELLAGLENSVA